MGTLPIAYQSGNRQRRSIVFTHEESLQYYLVELGISTSSKESVQLKTKIGIDKQAIGFNTIFECKIENIFLPISFNICFGCSKQPSH